ncbi:MAG: hypothetical protein IJ867_07810 [Clostridia bacterium]|nr:hypothetical protein [Clostridia bacterium]
MLDKNCNYLTAIAVSVIISFIFTLLFFIGTITGITIVFMFALALALLSLLLIGLFGISDNGLTRTRLCKSCSSLIISILGNILFSLFALTIPLISRKYWGSYSG